MVSKTTSQNSTESTYRKSKRWIWDRFALGQIWRNILHRRVAKGAWYFGDGATLFLLFIVLVATGAGMSLGYSPSTADAHSSVYNMSNQTWFGYMIRGLHYWSAGLMVVMTFFHLFRQILVGGYKSPREASWLIGVFLFFGVITMSLLGYILRWDERGIFALRVALNIFYRIPLIGEQMVLIVQGGDEIGQNTLSRIYSVHVIFGPLLITALIAYHLYLVIIHSITTPTERKTPVSSSEEQRRIYKRDAMSDERGERFFPDTAAKSGLMAAIVFGLVLVLSFALGGGKLYPRANLESDSYPMEEWWWSWFSTLAAYLPPSIATLFYVGFPLLLFIVLIALPFIERTPYRGIKNRPIATFFVAACVIMLIGLSSLRIRSNWTAWPQSTPPSVPAGLTLTSEAENGRILFAKYGCNTCHAIDNDGPRVGPDLAAVRKVWSNAELRNYILKPPPNVAMPSYEGRLTETQLTNLADFVLVVQTSRHR